MDADLGTPVPTVSKRRARRFGNQLELPFRNAAVGERAGLSPHVSVYPLHSWALDQDSIFAPLYETCHILFNDEEEGGVYPFVVTVKPATKSFRALKTAYSTAEAFCSALAATEAVGVHVDHNEANEIRLYVWPVADANALAKYHLGKAWKHVTRVFLR